MKLKRLLTVFLLIVLFMTQIGFIQFNNFTYAKDEVNKSQEKEKFHYEQLDATSKKIYNGLVAMKDQGILKTGTQNYDLVDNGFLTTEELKSYDDGMMNIKKAFYAARYAFYADYPEVFYVDFGRLAIRITKNAQGDYHAYIGAGNNTNYRTEGFENQEEVEAAITEFEAKVDEIVEETQNLEIATEKNPEIEKIRYVHNRITKLASYRLETDCKPGYEGFLGTPYGILVKGQGVCEGYARAFKTILDKLNLTCILVQGVYQEEDGSTIEHMWNYVQITEQEATARAIVKNWYAVDVTMDDPYHRKVKIPGQDYSDREPGWDIVEGFENTRYLLVGKEAMLPEHIAIEKVVSAGDYVFKYPELRAEDLGIDKVTDIDGLVVKFKQEGIETEEYKSGDYFVSYQGMGYKRAMEQGYYILMKSHYYRPADEVWEESKWAYFLDGVYAGGFVDKGDHVYVTIPNSEYLEFAVTQIAPGDYENDPTYLAYQGDESGLEVQSGKLYNPNGNYKAKPYVKQMTPEATASLEVGRTYPVTVVYDDDLVLEEGVTQVTYKIESSGLTGTQCAKVENFKWDGKRTITFNFTPSKMFADDGASYAIYPIGIVGKNSRKAPMEITYGAVNGILCSFRMNAARNWELFARPILMENEDLSLNGWKTEDGEDVADKLKNRITLIATKTTLDEKEQMNELMEDKLQTTKQEVLQSSTYNLSLNACKQYVIKTGHRVRLSVGFPEGYGPEDAGVTFKAYHFKKDTKGNVIEVEEIPCVVTQYGLIITCDSFSPFAVAAVNVDETQPANTTKAIIVSSAENGSIVAKDPNENATLKQAGNILDINENESKTFTILPKEGYEIEKVTVCGNIVEVPQKDSMEVTVNYNDIQKVNNIVDATFVAKEVTQAEEARGESVVIPKTIPATITINESEVTVTTNEKLTLEPTVSQTAGSQIYQWYKDGVRLVGQTNKTLEIEAVKMEDAGSYTLEVTTAFDMVTKKAMSQEYRVTVKKAAIASDKYEIGQDNISGIAPGTTVNTFKSNVDNEQELTFFDKDGKAIQGDTVLATGMKVKVGATLQYTLVVTGDIDGDTRITINDLAKIKLHYIEMDGEELTGVYLKAADIDKDGRITVNDVAQIKLVIIDELEIK